MKKTFNEDIAEIVYCVTDSNEGRNRKEKLKRGGYKVSTKIIADVSEEIKQKLSDLAHIERSNMKKVLVRLIEQEYEKVMKNEE